MADQLDPLLYRRARHVVTENWRVLESVWALNVANVEALGRFMNESHASLRDDYAVSSPELSGSADASPLRSRTATVVPPMSNCRPPSQWRAARRNSGSA